MGRIEGDIFLNGHPKVQSTFARVMGYVEQFDIHSPNLTVGESLQFAGVCVGDGGCGGVLGVLYCIGGVWECVLHARSVCQCLYICVGVLYLAMTGWFGGVCM